jgi:hypothetical protein
VSFTTPVISKAHTDRLKMKGIGQILRTMVVAGVAAAAKPRPNFIVLFADDMGYSQPSGVVDKSVYAGDGKLIATPNMDKMASESVVRTSRL